MATLLDDTPDLNNPSPELGDTHYNELTNRLAKSEQGGGFYNKGDSPSKNTPTKDELAASEKSQTSGSGLFNPGSTKFGSKKKRLKDLVKVLAKKKTVIGGAVGAPIAVTALLILILAAGALKLPNVMSEIEAYQFANLTTDFAQSSEKVTEENLAIDATTSSTYTELQDNFTSGLTNTSDSLWSKMTLFSPGEAIQNLGESGGFQLNYKYNAFGGKQWIGGVLDGKEYTVADVGGIGQWVPGLRDVLQSRNAAITRGQLISDIMGREEVSSLGVIAKGKIFLNLLDATDGSLAGWALNKFTGENGQQMTDQQAVDEATIQTEQSSEQGANVADNAVTSEITQAEDEYKTTLAADESNPQKLTGIVKSGGYDKYALLAADQVLGSSLLEKGLSAINPLYGLFVPLCIVYDGSVQTSGPAIANQINQQVDVFDKLASEADQQKQGSVSPASSQELANAVNGTNAELGNITNSIPYKRASGQPITTLGITSPEAGSDGSYTYSLFNVAGISGPAASFLNAVIQPVCRTMTNPDVAIGVAVANIVAAIDSFGQSDYYENMASHTVTAYINAFANYLAGQILSSQGEDIGASLGAKVVIEGTTLSRGIAALRLITAEGAKQSAGILGLTFLADSLVSARAGLANSGLVQGQALINQADSGANIEANELERTQLFGRPLTPSEVSNEVQNAAHLIAKANASKSTYQRFFALSNPSSLLSHIGLTLGNYLHPKVLFAAFFKLCAEILHPASLFSAIFSIGSVRASAQTVTPPIGQVYGNIQFGWTKSEKALINSNNSYFPLENEKILRQSGEETAIAKTYANCFGYVYNSSGNGDMDPTDPNGDLNPAASGLEPGSLATLITSNDIPRDNSGNVLESGGLCSPQNLGVNNPTYGDLVFRWRLAMNYDTTLQSLTNLQTIN
jgi:hypothetical protein